MFIEKRIQMGHVKEQEHKRVSYLYGHSQNEALVAWILNDILSFD